MPKMKTNSSAAKRFKVTGTGKIKRKHAFKSHQLTHGIKSNKTKRHLRQAGLVSSSDMPQVKKYLAI